MIDLIPVIMVKSALRFDGVDDYVDAIPAQLINSLSDNLTLEVVCRCMNIKNSIPVGCQAPSTARLYIGINTGGWAFGIGASTWITTSLRAVVLGEEVRLTLTVDKAGNAAKLHVNGVLVETKTGWTWTNQTGNTWFGANNAGTPSNPFEGFISKVALFNRALSSSEVADGTTRSGLVGEWQFDEGLGSVVKDNVGTNNGIISGAMWDGV